MNAFIQFAKAQVFRVQSLLYILIKLHIIIISYQNIYIRPQFPA